MLRRLPHDAVSACTMEYEWGANIKKRNSPNIPKTIQASPWNSISLKSNSVNMISGVFIENITYGLRVSQHMLHMKINQIQNWWGSYGNQWKSIKFNRKLTKIHWKSLKVQWKYIVFSYENQWKLMKVNGKSTKTYWKSLNFHWKCNGMILWKSMEIIHIQWKKFENLLKIIDISMEMQWYALMKINENLWNSIEIQRKSIENHWNFNENTRVPPYDWNTCISHMHKL